MPDTSSYLKSFPLEIKQEIWSFVLGLMGGGAVLYLLLTGEVRVAITVTLALLFATLAVMRIQAAILAVMVYLTLLGDIRRLLIPVAGWSGTDPLLLIGPVFVLILFAYALASQSIQIDTRLSQWTAALMIVMILQIFNPRQGSLMVGVAGAMFYLIPLVWFWVGRVYATPEFMHTLLFKIVVPLGVLAAIYGTYHVIYGYLPHQQLWYHLNWHPGLGSLEDPAPVSFFSSNAEHASYLAVATVLSWAAFLRGYRPALLLVPVFLTAIAMTGIRGPLFFSLVMMAGLWAVLSHSKGAWIVRGVLALVIAGAGLMWSLTQASQMEMSDQVRGGIDRQAKEFVGAASGENSSSAANHFGMMLYGYTVAIQEPLGLGLGSTTRAAAKFEGGVGGSTETAFSDTFVALGLPGGIIYHIVIFLIVLSSFRYWVRTRSVLALAIMGLLGVTMANIVAGGAYALGPLISFTAGALDRFANRKVE